MISVYAWEGTGRALLLPILREEFKKYIDNHLAELEKMILRVSKIKMEFGL